MVYDFIGRLIPLYANIRLAIDKHPILFYATVSDKEKKYLSNLQRVWNVLGQALQNVFTCKLKL